MKALLIRLSMDESQTLGRMYLYDGEKQPFTCVTLELPDRDNEQNVSRIPDGVYRVKKRKSVKYGSHFHILDVPDRSYILMHPGNFYRDTRGCVLMGTKFVHIDDDNKLDVYMSRATVNELLRKAPKEFELTVKTI